MITNQEKTLKLTAKILNFMENMRDLKSYNIEVIHCALLHSIKVIAQDDPELIDHIDDAILLTRLRVDKLDSMKD